jgi:hypothetical protein
MLSAGVLEAEKAVMDEIIEYKKLNKIEFYDFFELKKDLIDGQIQNIQNLIVSENLTLEGYKANCQNQLNYENKLLEFLKNDKNVSEKEINIIKERINKRIEILNIEIEQEVPEDEEEESGDANENKDGNEDKDKDTNLGNNLNQNKNSKNENETGSETIKLEALNNNINTNKVIEIKDKFLYETLKKRLNEYQLAIEYFDKHNLTSQSNDALGKTRDIKKVLNLLESGKEDINQKEIPESITPDYISGCSKQERFEKFSKLIKEYSNMKNDLVNKRNKILEKFNLMEKREQNKIVNIYIKYNVLSYYIL